MVRQPTLSKQLRSLNLFSCAKDPNNKEVVLDLKKDDPDNPEKTPGFLLGRGRGKRLTIAGPNPLIKHKPPPHPPAAQTQSHVPTSLGNRKRDSVCTNDFEDSVLGQEVDTLDGIDMEFTEEKEAR